MDAQHARRLRHYLGLAYPMAVCGDGVSFTACHPDLPGCSVAGARLPELYAKLEAARRDWLTARLLGGQSVPPPNAHLAERGPRRGTTQPLDGPRGRVAQ